MFEENDRGTRESFACLLNLCKWICLFNKCSCLRDHLQKARCFLIKIRQQAEIVGNLSNAQGIKGKTAPSGSCHILPPGKSGATMDVHVHDIVYTARASVPVLRFKRLGFFYIMKKPVNLLRENSLWSVESGDSMLHPIGTSACFRDLAVGCASCIGLLLNWDHSAPSMPMSPPIPYASWENARSSCFAKEVDIHTLMFNCMVLRAEYKIVVKIMLLVWFLANIEFRA